MQHFFHVFFTSACICYSTEDTDGGSPSAARVQRGFHLLPLRSLCSSCVAAPDGAVFLFICIALYSVYPFDSRVFGVLSALGVAVYNWGFLVQVFLLWVFKRVCLQGARVVHAYVHACIIMFSLAVLFYVTCCSSGRERRGRCTEGLYSSIASRGLSV